MSETRAEKRAARIAEALAKQRRHYRPEDFVYDASQDAFWELGLRAMYADRVVDGLIPVELWRVEVEEPPPGSKARPKEKLIPPSKDLRRVELQRIVETSTWWPGRPTIIENTYIGAQGPEAAPGARIFNRYRPPPAAVEASPEGAALWVDHVRRIWPEDAERFFDFAAHMVQRPEEKCNWAVVLSGRQGIGKDFTLAALREVVGEWNCRNIDPDDLFSPFRPWLEAVLLIVDEVRPSKDDYHATSMYNILKPLAAAPPNVLPLNDKHMKVRYVPNVMRVVLTTNNWLALFVPEEDRRMFILHSTLTRDAFPEDYFPAAFAWLRAGGPEALRAWLAARDISRFDPAAEAPRTAAKASLAASWGTGDDAFGEWLEAAGRPAVFFGAELVAEAVESREEMARLLRSARRFAHRIEAAGYEIMPLPADGRAADRWSFSADGRTFRSRVAAYRPEEFKGRAEALRAIEERGLALARALASGTVIPFPKRSEMG